MERFIRLAARLIFVFLTAFVGLLPEGIAIAKVHTAPIIVPGFKVRHATRYPISSYRLFASTESGEALPIPFQIDELNQYGDYVLDKGSNVTKNDGNGIFDLHDELAYMGDDVGPAKAPTKWSFAKPTLLFEVRHSYRDKQGKLTEGAVYIGIYFGQAPPLSKKQYVAFDQSKGEVKTSRYVYRFDKKNYLVVNGVEMTRPNDDGSPIPLIESSTFYMKADLKYFLTLEVHHKDIQSYLEAFKIGPIRTIVRVTFFYRFLKINFELGMYTELSLFSNSVVLPAIMYNPLNGDKSLNPGSGFYYGFAIKENPSTYNIETNIPRYTPPKNGILEFFSSEPKLQTQYWLSITGKDRMMYFEIAPSQEMLERRNVPTLYVDEKSSEQLHRERANNKAQPLGKSPVNLGLHFDLTKFKEGEHRISFRLYFDNHFDQQEMDTFKSLEQWSIQLKRI